MTDTVQKTYKREVSAGLLVVLFAFFIAGMWFPEAMQSAEFLTAPIFMFGAAAFGVDAYSKQVLR
jgi:hypothetical protein